jgi:hypothetical protein
MIVALIPARDLPLAWPGVWPLLEPAVERTPGKPDVLAALQKQQADRWAVYEGEKPVAAVVTQIQDKPVRRVLLWLVGGSRMREWVHDFLAMIEPKARAVGCVALWGCGRRGWLRVGPLLGAVRIDDHNGMPAWERRIA